MPPANARHDHHAPLDAFLGAWFHQDCAMHGETLTDIVADCRGATDDAERRALRDDIARFLANAGGNVDAHLAASFDLDIVPSAFAADGEDFLRTIWRLLDAT